MKPLHELTFPISVNVCDIETSVNNIGDEAIGNSKAAVFHKDNNIVLVGTNYFKINDVDIFTESSYYEEDGDEDIAPWVGAIFVGQNVGFDLLYIRKDNEEHYQKIMQQNIWDTMIVEYLLTGQDSKFQSLDKLATKYGGTIKNDEIKEMWDAGIKTEDIPRELLSEYLKADVDNTTLIFQKQYEKACELGMLPLIHTMMESRKATLEMEWNGMYFDVDSSRDEAEVLLGQLTSYEEIIEEIMDMSMPNKPVSAGGMKDLSIVLFGGEYEYKKKEPETKLGVPVMYKSGKKKGTPRLKNVTIHGCASGLVQGELLSIVEPKANSAGTYFTTPDSLLQDILKNEDDEESLVYTLVDSVLEMRKIKKDISTYYTGLAKLTWEDGLIHPSYNHAATATGRLSSSKPNFQNISN